MAGIYRATLRRIQRREYDVFAGRASLPALTKVGIALRVFLAIWAETYLLSPRKPSEPKVE
jgi:hypothetical protein